MPAAIQRFIKEPSFYLVTRPVVHLAIEIIDLMQLVVVSVPANVPPTPSRRTVNMSGSTRRSYWLSSLFWVFVSENSGQNNHEPFDVEGKLLSGHAFRRMWVPSSGSASRVKVNPKGDSLSVSPTHGPGI